MILDLLDKMFLLLANFLVSVSNCFISLMSDVSIAVVILDDIAFSFANWISKAAQFSIFKR